MCIGDRVTLRLRKGIGNLRRHGMVMSLQHPKELHPLHLDGHFQTWALGFRGYLSRLDRTAPIPLTQDQDGPASLLICDQAAHRPQSHPLHSFCSELWPQMRHSLNLPMGPHEPFQLT